MPEFALVERGEGRSRWYVTMDGTEIAGPLDAKAAAAAERASRRAALAGRSDGLKDGAERALRDRLDIAEHPRLTRWSLWRGWTDGFRIEVACHHRPDRIDEDKFEWGATVHIDERQMGQDCADLALPTNRLDGRGRAFFDVSALPVRLPYVHGYRRTAFGGDLPGTISLAWDYQHHGWTPPRRPDDVVADCREVIAALMERWPALLVECSITGKFVPRSDCEVVDGRLQSSEGRAQLKRWRAERAARDAKEKADD